MLKNRNVSAIQQYVGEYLKHEMKQRGITQEAFAELIHTDPRTVRRWWKGEGVPMDILETISRLFNVPVRDIFLEWEDVPSFLHQNIFYFYNEPDITCPVRYFFIDV